MPEELTTARGAKEAREEAIRAEHALAPAGMRPGARSRASVARGLVAAARPRQWLKNSLVVAAPGAAGVLTEGPVLLRVALAFAAFCLVASGTYLLNDSRDADSDRRHPDKRHRPIAAGLVPVRVAVAAGVGLLVGGFGVAVGLGWRFLAVIGLYVLLTTAYTLWLKHVAVVDIAIVASGFIIRAVAGGVAADVPISRWFLIVASFGSLFMVAGKRHGEHIDLGPERASIRATLAAYSRNYLRYVWTMASGVTLGAYCLWAFEQSHLNAGSPWYELSIVPFVLGVLRYALLLERGRGSAPEEIVLSDRTLQAIGVVWVATFACGVYLG